MTPDRIQQCSYMTKPLQGVLFWKFRNQIMGVIPARDPGPGKAKPRSGELDTQKVKPSRKGKTARKGLVPPGNERHHRIVLGEVSKRTKDGHKKDGHF
jgi:hypothetical protein